MDNLKIPRHVAVIMDGNGRWAKSKGLPRKMGHVQGGKNVEDMLYVCDDLGIKYFTVYAVSTENWKRSEDEVAALMTLLRSYRCKEQCSYTYYRRQNKTCAGYSKAY